MPQPPVPAPGKPALTSDRATFLFLADPRVVRWLQRYPSDTTTSATYANGRWTVGVFYGKAGEIATGSVDDVTGAVLEAWLGPQVAWTMARGLPGAFGGKKIN